MLWWLLAGALWGFGVAGLLTIGFPLLIGGIVMVVVGTLVPRLRHRSAFMLLTGAATAPALVAWLNREGPGQVCHASATATSCGDQWSPWPFLAVAVVMATAGTFLALRRRGRS